MSDFKPTKTQQKTAKKLLDHFEANRHLVIGFSNQVLGYLREDPRLAPFIHTFKDRIKSPDRFIDKIYRKMADAKDKGQEFSIDSDNLFSSINDLAGIRILHLYTTQIKEIDPALRGIFEEQKLKLVEPPFARTWDDEYRNFFEQCGIHTQDSPTLYTSVHYVVESGSQIPVTCELQVRTLAEEIWGEVDHDINYPHEIDSVACKEQIRTLARATSTVTRMVDSIYATVEDIKQKPNN